MYWIPDGDDSTRDPYFVGVRRLFRLLPRRACFVAPYRDDEPTSITRGSDQQVQKCRFSANIPTSQPLSFCLFCSIE